MKIHVLKNLEVVFRKCVFQIEIKCLVKYVGIIVDTKNCNVKMQFYSDFHELLFERATFFYYKNVIFLKTQSQKPILLHFHLNFSVSPLNRIAKWYNLKYILLFLSITFGVGLTIWEEE